MKTTELRIGNYIIDTNGLKDYYKVFLLEDGYINTSKEDSIQPIQLTEEWLLKLGGVDNNYTIDFKCSRKKICFSWASKVVSDGRRHGFHSNKYPHIKYVHQLQNLYFALTGEELKIKL